MEFNSKVFSDKLKALMQGQSVMSFASQCGISRSNMSRFLNDPNVNKPSMRTLQKIADGSGANYEELLTICGYASTPADARKKRSFEERVKMNASDMMEGFSSLTHGCTLYDSVEDFISTYNILYATEDCKYGISKIKEYEGDLHPGEESYVVVTSVFRHAEGGTCFTYSVLFLAETKGGHVVITNAAFDGKSLLEAEFVPPETLEKLGLSKEEIAERDCFYYVRETAEQKLLRTIFGDGDEMRAMPSVIPGFGFEIEGVPRKFDEFVKAHRNSVPDFTKSIEEYLDTIDHDPETYFSSCEELPGSDFRNIIAEIMKTETNIPFEVYNDTPDNDNPECIMVANGIDKYPLCQLKEITKKYAKELGIREYGECFAFVYEYENKELHFTVEEGE